MNPFSKTTATIWFYRLAITRFFLFVIVTVGAAIQTTLSPVKWESLDHQQKFLTVVGICVMTASTIGAFFDKTMSRIANGKDPILDVAQETLTVQTTKTSTSEKST